MLVAAMNMHEYFRDALRVAVGKASLCLTDAAQAYLVHLLSEFSRSEKVYAGLDHGEKPALALLLSKAQEAQPEEAVRIFKHLGDSSLYLIGFFHEAQERQMVGADYYMSMGESGYSSVAVLVREQAAKTAALYHELSDHFRQLVTVFHAISLQNTEENGKVSASRLLELVERYKRTLDPEILEYLEQHGVSLDPNYSADSLSLKNQKRLIN